MNAAATPDVSYASHDGLPNPKRTLAFLTLAMGVTMAVLDGGIVNVALPVIALEQHASAGDAIWVVTACQLAVVVALLPMATLGEAIGFRKVLFSGLLIFSVTSLLCAYSTSIPMLTLFRVLQGIGGAAIMSVSSALVRFVMPVRYLGRGISSMAVVVAISGAAGPSIAAAILAVTSWHWLFLVNVPIGLVCLLVGRITLPMTPIRPSRFDYVSAVLNVLTFGPLISGLTGIGSSQIPLWASLAQIAFAVLAGYGLVRRQKGKVAPMLPVDLLRIRAFAFATVASIISFAAQFLAVVSLPFFLSRVLGFNEVETGLLMTPWPVATAIIAPIAGRLADRYASARLSGLGSFIFALGLALTALMPAEPTTWDICWRLALTGIGFGLFQSPNNKAMLSSTPRERSGGASGMQATSRVFGQSVGAAMAAIIFGVTAGYNLVLTMTIAATLALVASVLSIWR
jgi:DHA2 family multidrug resistance protein-like MFS transporter